MSRDLLPPIPDQSLALRALDMFRRRRLLALVVFATVLAAAASFALHLPDLYRATATVIVERQVAESFVRPAVTGELESRLHQIKQEILSRDRLTDLVNRFRLYPELRAKGSLEDVLDQTRRDIQVDQSGPEQVTGRTKTVAFRVSYTGPGKQTVADVTNALAAFYVFQNDSIRSKEATNTTDFLKGQLKEAKKSLDHQEENMRAYMARHSGELPQQVEVNLATLERLNTQLRLNGERQIRTLEQRQKQLADGQVAAATAAADAAAGTPTRIDLDQPPDVRLDKMKRDLAVMETKYRDKHPDVLRLKSEIAALERESAEQKIADAKAAPDPATDPAKQAPQIRQAALASLDGELDKLKKEEAELRGMIAGVEKRLEVVPERQQEFGQISRDHESAKELYESLLKKYDEASLAESMETDKQGERFRVVESAVMPDGPAAPNRPQLLVLSVILAVFSSVLALLLVEQIDTTFHSVDEVREFTSVPVLVAIPAIPSGAGMRIFKTAMATASVIVVIGLVASIAAHFAQGNDEIVRILAKVA